MKIAFSMMNSIIKQYCGFGSGMGNNQDPGSGINIPDPQYCNKVYLILGFLFFSLAAESW